MTTRRFRPWRVQALAFKAIRRLYPDYDLWRDFPYEYAFGKLAIDVINGGPGLREWVDDAAAHAGRSGRPDRAGRGGVARGAAAVPAVLNLADAGTSLRTSRPGLRIRPAFLPGACRDTGRRGGRRRRRGPARSGSRPLPVRSR